MNLKIVSILMLLLTVSSTHADILERCELETNFPNLQKEANKRAICNATFHALYPQVVREEYDYYLRIEAKGYRTMYSVQLTSIEGFIGNDLTERTSGVLKWNPDGEEVVLD